MSPRVCKGQLGERSARLPVLRGISACLPSPRAALSFLPADALEGSPYPTFFVNHIPPSSPLLLLSPPSLHPTHIMCWLTYGQACVPGNQSKDQLIVPEWNSSLLSSTRLLPLTLLHAQTQPIWKPPISCLSAWTEAGIWALRDPASAGVESWHSATSTLVRSIFLSTSPSNRYFPCCLSLSLCEQASSQKGFPDALVSSSTLLAAFRLKDAGSAQSWFTKSDSVQCSLYTGSLQTVPADFGTVFLFDFPDYFSFFLWE